MTAAAAVAFGRLADRIGTKLVLGRRLGYSRERLCGVGSRDAPETIAVVLLAGIGTSDRRRLAAPGVARSASTPNAFAGLKAAPESMALPGSSRRRDSYLAFGCRGVFVLLATAIRVAPFTLLRWLRPRAAPTNESVRAI